MNTDTDSRTSSYPQPLKFLPKSSSETVLQEDSEFERVELGERQEDAKFHIPCEGGCE
jgi:hypothetical protein